MISSVQKADCYETGSLGVFHLKRYWSGMMSKEGQNSGSVDRSDELTLDMVVLDGLGLGIVEPANYILRNSPDFYEFENWIINELGNTPSKEIIDKINSAIKNYLQPDRKTVEYPVPYRGYESVLSNDELDFWNENGYVILHNAISSENCKLTEKAIWEYVGADPDNPESWYSSEHNFWIPLYRHPAIQVNRESPRIKNAFAQLWGTEELWCNVDRCSLNLPVKDNRLLSGPNKLHWDVSLATPVPFGVQGILYLTDTVEDQGAFRCVSGFHNKINEWLKDLPAGVNPRDVNLEEFNPVPIPGKAGDLIIWHHALPHSSGVNRANFPRIVQYLKMYPVDYKIHAEWR
jgi:hypothetical protein